MTSFRSEYARRWPAVEGAEALRDWATTAAIGDIVEFYAGPPPTKRQRRGGAFAEAAALEAERLINTVDCEGRREVRRHVVYLAVRIAPPAAYPSFFPHGDQDVLPGLL